MQKSKTEFKVIKEDIVPMLFLCVIIFLFGFLLLGSFSIMDNAANAYCVDNIVNTSECSILNKESH